MVLAAQQDSLGFCVHLQVGRELLSSRPCVQEDVRARLQGLSSQWEELNYKMAERREQLQQARQRDQLLVLLQVRCREGKSTGQRTKLGWEQAGRGRERRKLDVLLALERL